MRSRLGFALALGMTIPVCAVASVTTIARIESFPLGSDSLTTSQIDNLVLLGKIWGFAKYHHPSITSGRVDWDSELLGIIPAVLKARGRAPAMITISNWLARLDAPIACNPCAKIPGDPYFQPRIDWIRDERILRCPLSKQLQRIYDNRRTDPSQQYVSFVPGVGNAVFTNEKEYDDKTLPDSDLRLLALYRFWNIIEYWSPYRDLIKEDWDNVLREFVPQVWASDDPDEYRLAMMALIARIDDGHANLWNALTVRPPRGLYRLPVNVRFIEGKAVVTGFTRDTLGRATGLRVGDVILSIGGARVDSLVDAWAPYYAASNQSARLRAVGRSLP